MKYLKIQCDNCKLVRLVLPKKALLIEQRKHCCRDENKPIGNWQVVKSTSKFQAIEDLYLNLFYKIYKVAEVVALKASPHEKHKIEYKSKSRLIAGKEGFASIARELTVIDELGRLLDISCLLDGLEIYNTILWYFAKQLDNCDPELLDDDKVSNNEQLQYLQELIDNLKINTAFANFKFL